MHKYDGFRDDTKGNLHRNAAYRQNENAQKFRQHNSDVVIFYT